MEEYPLLGPYEFIDNFENFDNVDLIMVMSTICCDVASNAKIAGCPEKIYKDGGISSLLEALYDARGRVDSVKNVSNKRNI